MRNNIWLTAVALAVLPCLAPAAGGAEIKIAVVSMERIFDEYYKTKGANVELKARADEIDVKRREMLADVKSLRNDLETLSAEARDKSLSETEREKKKQAAEERFTQLKDVEDRLQEYDKANKKQFGDQMRQTQLKLVGEIRETIEIYVKAHGITLVLDGSGKTLNSVESVVYYDKAMDITEAIIAVLNSKAPKTDAKQADVKEAKP